MTHTTQIEFKTGDLVAMDWFRELDGLQDWFAAQGADDYFLRGSGDNGILKTTESYAKLGVVYVFVGNSSPAIFTGDGMIVAGSNWREYDEAGNDRYSDDEDGDYDEATSTAPAGMTDEGHVCTDLWWVTMMERERLIEIFVDQLGEGHREEIEAYAAGQFDVNIKVDPGKYTLHYGPSPEDFYAGLDDKTKFKIGTPYFALVKE